MNAKKGWLIWFSNAEGRDGVLLQRKKVAAFNTRRTAEAFLHANDSRLKRNSEALYDFDFTVASRVLDCNTVLNLVNMLEDICANLAVNIPRIPTSLYDKLFYGCNLPSINPSQRLYKPRFTLVETAELNRFLFEARGLLENRIQWIENA